MKKQAIVEIFRAGRWWSAATITPMELAAGHNGACRLEYFLDYASEHIEDALAVRAGVSCRYPVDFDLHDEQSWPAFLLDILPNGAGRAHWLKRLNMADAHAADWPLLLRGTAFPPGNLRIKEAVDARVDDLDVPRADGEIVKLADHPGFTLEDICQRQEQFIEYAYQNGAQTAGASDVQGVAPKFLMTQDRAGRWHAEGVLDDDKIASHYLIKFPRGRTEADRQVLRIEALYMDLAKALGLKVHGPLQWQRDTLIIPRFDRVLEAEAVVTRIGMESLSALAGITKYGIEYGGSPSHNVLCQALARYTTDPEQELVEYIKRDIANVVLGNKDNHARNTAVFRYENGLVTLTPLFDFAPMYLDPEGIPRACRWEGDQEVGGTPNWQKVIAALPEGISYERLKTELAAFAVLLEQLPDIMEATQVDREIITARMPVIKQHVKQLNALDS
ncbi:HipA domain-containing protein [SAR92 clade bacterium H455]|uniref:HipA domain-containing protein n=1 Tax=SAR92 clade bacterium H455 TaxID=2974818 RepID=A0ABY5TJZ3_9GAMM|nr:HipA domain-containing protein [SAR92 clade bacterium H455]